MVRDLQLICIAMAVLYSELSWHGARTHTHTVMQVFFSQDRTSTANQLTNFCSSWLCKFFFINFLNSHLLNWFSAHFKWQSKPRTSSGAELHLRYWKFPFCCFPFKSNFRCGSQLFWCLRNFLNVLLNDQINIHATTCMHASAYSKFETILQQTTQYLYSTDATITVWSKTVLQACNSQLSISDILSMTSRFW